jgi:L-fuculose-phosphate aldolase
VRSAPFAPSGSDEVAKRCVAALDGRRAMLLGGHGVVAIGDTPSEALVTCQSVERQAQIAWLLRGCMSA